MDKYSEEYLIKIKAAETDDQILDIIEDIYDDGVEDGSREKND